MDNTSTVVTEVSPAIPSSRVAVQDAARRSCSALDSVPPFTIAARLLRDNPRLLSSSTLL
jgi:hypothetical protein